MWKPPITFMDWAALMGSSPPPMKHTHQWRVQPRWQVKIWSFLQGTQAGVQYVACHLETTNHVDGVGSIDGQQSTTHEAHSSEEIATTLASGNIVIPPRNTGGVQHVACYLETTNHVDGYHGASSIQGLGIISGQQSTTHETYSSVESGTTVASAEMVRPGALVAS